MSEIKWLKYALTHVSDGFEELRFRKKGSVKIAVVIVLMFFVADVVSDRLYGFQFRISDDRTFNVIPHITSSIGLFLAWVTGCSAVSTFLDGEGTARNTAIYTAYALVPYIAQKLINTILSHVLTRDEFTFMQIIQLAGTFWTVILLFSAVKAVHRYTFIRTVISIVTTVFFMLIMLFLLILFMSLIQQMWLFVSAVYTEILYRIRG
ncbi:MAG: YIP1 family protein [Ruminococcus sp.]|nr:YIP1 family protein [Ruminococcus sp.]